MSPCDEPKSSTFLQHYVEHEEALRGFVRSMVASRGDAQEIMQDVALLADEAEDRADAFEAERAALEECLGKIGPAQRTSVDAAYAPGMDERYTLRMASFVETPEEIHYLWDTWQEMAEKNLTLVKMAKTFPAKDTVWQTLNKSLELLRDARCVMISLGADRDDSKAKCTPHYIDDVHVRLVMTPRATPPAADQP